MHPKPDPARPEITADLLAHFVAEARRERAKAYEWAFGRVAALLRRATGRR